MKFWETLTTNGKISFQILRLRRKILFILVGFCNYLIDLLFDNSNFLQAIGLRMFTVQLWNVPRQDFS